MWQYLRAIAHSSFHGGLRLVEVCEALAAVTCYSVGYFVPGAEKYMKVACVGIVILFLCTFVAGLFWAAYKRDRESAAEISRLKDVDSEKLTEIQRQLSLLRRPEVAVVAHLVRFGRGARLRDVGRLSTLDANPAPKRRLFRSSGVEAPAALHVALLFSMPATFFLTACIVSWTIGLSPARVTRGWAVMGDTDRPFLFSLRRSAADESR